VWLEPMELERGRISTWWHRPTLTQCGRARNGGKGGSGIGRRIVVGLRRRQDAGVEEVGRSRCGAATRSRDRGGADARGPVWGKRWRVGRPLGCYFGPAREHSNISELIRIFFKRGMN
jgi:hypothetical protein